MVVKKVEQCAVGLSTVNRAAPQDGGRLSAGPMVTKILSDPVDVNPRTELVVDIQLPPIKPRHLPTRLDTQLPTRPDTQLPITRPTTFHRA
jgi:hypothetical protein